MLMSTSSDSHKGAVAIVVVTNEVLFFFVMVNTENAVNRTRALAREPQVAHFVLN